MKNYKKLSAILLVGIFLAASGCEDFLDKPPLGESLTTSYFTSASDAEASTNGIYNSLRRWNITGGFPILDIMSDEASKGSSPTDASFLLEFENFKYNPNQGQLTQMWNNLYLSIRRANSVINNVPGIEMDETLKKRLIAEARFLRAYFYFELVKGYGAVPLILDDNSSYDIGRTPADQIYSEVIIPDLEFAESTLPEKSEYASADLGRATRGAAKSLLAKVYLFLKDYQSAEQYAVDVIESGEYSLDPSFDNVFDINNVQGSGSIFEISSTSANFDNGGNQYANTYGVRGQFITAAGDTVGGAKGWGFIRPTVDFINSFEEGDPRMDASVVFLGEVIDGETILGDGGTPDTIRNDQGDIMSIETYVQKTYVPGTINNVTWGSNRIILRLADVLLMAAEAANENGESATALMYLNQVRARARGGDDSILPDIEETDQAALKRLILDERKYELAFEQHRFHDLVRTGMAPEILGPLGFVEGKHELLPIPQADIDITEGQLSQNPNY